MDPFTQRMLERAKARREKLDSQLSNAGHDIKKRSPLKDANAILAQAPVISSKLAAKSPVKQSPLPSPVKMSKTATPKETVNEPVEERGKENGVRSKLHRLGKLYSGDSNRELSSPIHKTEEKFMSEDAGAEHKPVKAGARLNRLAALASTINNWEDDLSHPSVAKATTVSKAEKIQAKMNEQVKSASEPQPSTSGYNTRGKTNNSSPMKQLKWDKSVLDNLEAQGFSRSKSNAHLEYTYKVCCKETNENLQKSKQTLSPLQKAREKTPEKPPGSPCSSQGSDAQKSPEKSTKSTNSGSPGSVLSKASMFESKSSQPKAKDPAEMSLLERMALFERNNTGEPLIPKAPLTMSVPTKMLMSKEKIPQNSESSGARSKNDNSGKCVGAQRAMFEQGTVVQEMENNILQSVHNERQRELDMLKSRFNRNKDALQAAAGSGIRTSESSEGKPNSPKNSPVCPVKPTPAPQDYIPLPPPLPKSQNSHTRTLSPSKRQGAAGPVKSQYQSLAEVKRVRVSGPKAGQLYPNLSNIEVTDTESETEFTLGTTEPETATLGETETESTTEAEYHVQDEFNTSGDSDIGNTSLGRSILHVVKQQSAFTNKKRSIDPDPDSTTSDISVLEEMDEYLDECLANQETMLASEKEGPTPPKLNKGFQSPSAASTSFRYRQGSYRSPVKITSAPSPRKGEPYIFDGDKNVPLLHSVSSYRRQQSQTPKTPTRAVSRIQFDDDSSQEDERNEAAMVQEKVKTLLDEVCKQETTIGQASRALNLCNSTVEFYGSGEQVEGERHLLLATHRRQAALQEVQRLKVEGTMRPVISGSSEVQESGSLIISAISLPLKRDFFVHKEADTTLHFVCLVRHLDTVVATPAVQAEIGDSCLRFPSTLKLQGLYSDFTVNIEVYSLETQGEYLPHEIKYHINQGNVSSNISHAGKKMSGKTPKKFPKQDNRLIMPSVQSPAGPSAVRSPLFALAGYAVFSLKEVHRQQFTLNKVPRNSPLEGRLQMHIECELSVSVEHRGFLTMFEDISGFGAWHRRWCLLTGATLSYWKYPDDERKKTPIGSLDLQGVSTVNVGLVSRDICARPNTFLLETARPALPGDTDSLVLVRNGSKTIIRHLISADTKEDRLEWCAKLNKTLHLIKAWGTSPTK